MTQKQIDLRQLEDDFIFVDEPQASTGIKRSTNEGTKKKVTKKLEDEINEYTLDIKDGPNVCGIYTMNGRLTSSMSQSDGYIKLCIFYNRDVEQVPGDQRWKYAHVRVRMPFMRNNGVLKKVLTWVDFVKAKISR